MAGCLKNILYKSTYFPIINFVVMFIQHYFITIQHIIKKFAAYTSELWLMIYGRFTSLSRLCLIAMYLIFINKKHIFIILTISITNTVQM